MGISADGREMVNGRRCGASFCTVIGLSWTCPAWNWTVATPPPFVLGNAVGIKDARKGRQPMPYMSRAAREYRLPCPLPFRVRTTMLTTTLRYFLNCFQGLNSSAWSVSGCFLNADAGLDTEQFSRRYNEHEFFPNVAFNKRLGKQGEENS